MADIDTKIAEVEGKLHLLELGEVEVEVSYQGRLVKFNQTNQTSLESYLAKLKAERDGKPRRGAIGLSF